MSRCRSDSLSRYGFTNTRVYVTGSNLMTWTHYSGFSPDVSSLGIGNVNRGSRRRTVSAGEELHVRHQHHVLSARNPINESSE